MSSKIDRTWGPLGLELARVQISIGIDIEEMAEDLGIKTYTLVRVMQGKQTCSRMLARVIMLTYQTVMSDKCKQMISELMTGQQPQKMPDILEGLTEERAALVKSFAEVVRADPSIADMTPGQIKIALGIITKICSVWEKTNGFK